ncbi:tRNA pseudouridine(55) synthase TruB [Marivibrio halodurans]|uniref:tRNA pseudouridine synthase B n=1 Tax=Marivibrio halodurans TaxID=2039722 RepID=A0A8J7V5B6_9PROT|nr:tRNA pseudouridine(55) synthase TruB [Marivibrio halodurans]MBP5858709.1 tRNA pseudouridine(55) synthase TruB [Marivibrio halodurans]
MGRRKKGQPIDGWLVLDKPAGLGSTDAVNRARRLFDARKAGHGGTLDPFATGLLPIAFGEATKTVQYVMDGRKTYRFTIRFGVETDTLDIDGTEVARAPADHLDGEAVAAVLSRFLGTIEQVPPAYSAIKVDGKRAYDRARGGEEVTLAARPVRIDALTPIGFRQSAEGPEAEIEVRCGKGTYVRSLARDIAGALGTVGHVAALRRTAVAGFGEEAAISLEALEQLGHNPAALAERLLPIEAALDGIPVMALSEAETMRLRNGQAVSLLRKIDLDRIAGLADGDELVALHKGKAVALARYAKGGIKPVRVLNTG